MSIVMSESTRTAWKKHEGRCSGAYFFFTVCEIHFSGFVHFTFFWLYQSIGFEGNIMYAKKGIVSATECADVVGFTLAT